MENFKLKNKFMYGSYIILLWFLCGLLFYCFLILVTQAPQEDSNFLSHLFILHPHRNRYNLDIWPRLLLCKKWHLANTYSISRIENPGSTRHHKSRLLCIRETPLSSWMV